MPRPSRLNSATASMTRQHYRQHDSATTSCHNQAILVVPSLAWLGGTITTMTRFLHHVMAKSSWQHHCQHDSAAPSPVWLSSTITNMTRQGHHTTTWLSTSTIYIFSDKQTRCQLIMVLFTIMFGSRANASVLLHCLAPLWSIYLSMIHIWRFNSRVGGYT
jgi:hypothetical protein